MRSSDFQFLDHVTWDEYLVQLRLEDPIQFHYFHGPALNGLLCSALNRHPLGSHIALNPVESGRIAYRRGDPYKFSLTLIGHCPELAQKIESGLSLMGQAPPPDKTFGRFEVIEFESLAQPNKPVNFSDDITLQFVTPLRMERTQGTKGKQFFDPTFFDAPRFLRLLYDRAYDLGKLSATPLPPYHLPDIPKTHTAQTSLIWIDAPYHAQRKTFGGVVGLVKLKATMSHDWKHLLWLGQCIQVGRNSAFGFGRYLLNPPHQETNSPSPKAARTIQDLALSAENMMEAFQHVKFNQGRAGSDGETINDFSANLFLNLDDLARSVSKQKYHSHALTGVILPKSQGNIRALAIPTLRDRILQRAVTQVLSPVWDLLLEESSFAYRKGLSRAGAAQAIQKAYNQGFRYILESDIESFFDNVDWDILQDKLHALLIQDPVVDLIMSWVTQDVVFEGQVVKRTRGLPQGAAISPLLANLYLDQFDEALQDDFRLIRYSDDFVVLCKSKKSAENALKRAQSALAPLKLQIKSTKTHIVDFEQGFQYLGYIFCRSVILESKKEKQPPGAINIENLSPDQIPPNHWLTHVDLGKIKEIKQAPSPSTSSLATDRDVMSDGRFPVYLTDPDVFVRLSGQSLVLSYQNRQDTEAIRIPLAKILAVIDYGRPSITLPAVVKLSQADIPTYFQDYTGKTYLTIPSVLPDYALWSRQMECRSHPLVLSRFAQAVTCAKIHNYRVMCTRRQWDNQVIQELKDLESKCGQTDKIATMRGYEGRAAATYFQAFSHSVLPKWNFQGRVKHPPTDPINAMLSLGYSCLYHHITTALQICALNPAVGWYHEPRANYMALACDVQEEFRYLVDGLVLYLLNRNKVTPEDFEFDQSSRFPVLMSNSFRKLFLSLLEERLMTEFKPDDKTKSTISYRRFFIRQARQIQTICHHPEKCYVPLRIH